MHGLSEPIGAVFDTQHGLTNAVLLPYVIRANGVCCPDRIGERYLSTGMCGMEFLNLKTNFVDHYLLL